MLDDYFGIVGRTLAGAFRVEEVIAEGGYAVVYRAEHVAFRAPVALKCLRMPGTATPAQSTDFVESFREEAEILFHLSASIPEVVRPLHADVLRLSSGAYVPYLAMEWVEGKPLDSIVILREQAGQPPLGLRELLSMLSPIAQALSKAHRFEVPGGGVVSVTHCDLKPENIVITERDSPVRAKILDFGIAKARDAVFENVGAVEQGEARPFTPNYGAPEQWLPKRYGQTGPWTDVWGLALTLTECVTGRPVIEGDLRSMMDQAIDPGQRPTPAQRGARVSEEVEAVFERALAVDPRERYTTIESFWRALERAAGVPSAFPERARRGAGADPPPVDAPAAAGGSLDIDDPFGDLPAPTAPDQLRDDELIGVEPPAPRAAPVEEFDSGEFYLPPSAKPITPPRRNRAEPGSSELSEDSGIRCQPEEGDDHKAPTSTRRPSSPRLELDDTPMVLRDTPATRPRRAAALASASSVAIPRAAPARLKPPSVAATELRDLRSKLVWPVAMVVLGLALTGVDMYVASSSGGYVMLGPVRLRWLAWALAAVGIVFALWSLVGDRRTE
jgi:serine/threonine protein kinase